MTAALSLVLEPSSTDTRSVENQFLDMLVHLDSGLISAKQLLTGILSSHYSFDRAEQHSTTLFGELGNLASIVNASRERMMQLTNLSHEAWVNLQIVRKAISIVLREGVEKRPLLKQYSDVVDYLTWTLGQDRDESVRILYLDSKNYLIKDEQHAIGTVNRTAFYPREVIKRVCELKAAAIVIAHNHPSGDPTPSTDDFDMTAQIAVILKLIGVELHDHIIVGQYRSYSFRGAGQLS